MGVRLPAVLPLSGEGAPPPPEEGGEEDGLKRIIEIADCRLGSAPILGEEESGSDAQCSAEC